MCFRAYLGSLLLFVLMFSSVFGQRVPCVDGFAGVYPCNQVDLLARMTDAQLGSNGRLLNDLWGWTDPVSGKEYAIVGLADGTSFVDISSPTQPIYLGRLPTHVGGPVIWRDIKTYNDHAFIVADHTANLSHGMQVFDLALLRTATNGVVTFTETAHYDKFSRAHNIVINEESGFAYAVGCVGGGTTCSGGLHMINIQDPVNPVFAGCYSGDGYLHDAQSVIYHGPDTPYVGREIVFAAAANEDTLTIIDVTNKSTPTRLSHTGYNGVRYAHQCWLTEDHRFLLLNDENDETKSGINTRTVIWSVENLDAPVFKGEFRHSTKAIDHNLYVRDRFVFEANYTAGLRILDSSRIEDTILQPVAHFDPHYTSDVASFNGAWSAYPFFESGVVILSDSEMGLYILEPQLDEIPDNRLVIHQSARENPLVSTNCPDIQLIVENVGTNAAVDVFLNPDITPYSLSLIDQYDVGDSVTDFGGGSSTNLEFALSFDWLTLDTQGAAQGWGMYTSRVMDARQSVLWDQLTWKPALPYGKELAPGGLADIGYPGVPAFGPGVFHVHPTQGLGKGLNGANLIFHLNETPATNGVAIVDASGRGNHGVFYTFDSDPHQVAGKFQSALAFDGDDRIDFDAPLMYTNGLAVSVSCWVQTTSDGTLFAQHAAGETNSLEIAIVSNRLAWVKNDAVLVHATHTVTDGEWHHLAVARSSIGTVRLYVDGALDSFGVDLGNILETNAVVGATGVSDYFVGTLDELALYQIGFSADEARELYTRGVNRLLFQVRHADDPTFSGVPFAGPAGITNAWFSEALNLNVGPPDMPLLATGRYSQYQVRFETDDPAYRPKLLNVRLGPEHVDPATGAVSVSQGSITAYDPLEISLGVIPGGSNAVVNLQVCMSSNTYEDAVSMAAVSWLSGVLDNSPMTNTYTVRVTDSDHDTLPDFADPDDDDDGIPDVVDLPDLALRIFAQPNEVVDNPALQYTVAVTNEGTDTADAVLFTSALPDDLTVIDYALHHPQLAALYDFEQDQLVDGGMVYDHSGHGRHGVVHTGLAGIDQSVPMEHGTGIELDGVNDWVEFPAFDLAEDYTISIWMRPGSAVDSGAFISKSNAAGGFEFVSGFFANEYSVRIRGDVKRYGAPASGAQHLLMSVSFDNGISTVTLYRDGNYFAELEVLDNLGDTSGGRGWALGQVWVGEVEDGFLAMAVDHVAFFDTALSPAQASRLYQLGPVGLKRDDNLLTVHAGPLDPMVELTVQIQAEVIDSSSSQVTNYSDLVLLEPDTQLIRHSVTNVVLIRDTDLDGQFDFSDPDDDGDGMSDDDEEIAGTDSKDETSLFMLRIERIPPDASRLGFNAVTGRIYQIEMLEDIGSESWVPIQSNLTGNGLNYYSHTNSSPEAFFRLGVEKQP